MSDLISRSALLKEVEKYKFGAISNDAERGYVKETILNFIEFQPAAYDVDRVVDELEALKSNLGFGGTIQTMYADGKIDRAVEIVKQGNVSDDVCEYRLFKGHKFLHKTSCGDVFDMQNGFKYCPCCGKKIKVIDK